MAAVLTSSRPPPHAPQPGDIVEGRYRINSVRASTPMTVVYEASQLGLGRNVTLELMMRDDDRAKRRFKRAARVVGMMRHPNVITVHETGQYDNLVYIVLESLDGQTLGERSRLRGPIPQAEFLPIARQLLSALHYVHQRRVIHRDVSAENVVLTKSWDGGEVLKLAQFGFSKDLGAATSTTTSGEAKQIVASLTHVAPEQILEPDSVDHRVDIYGCGALFYMLLTGVPAFRAQSLAELGGSILNSDPEPLRSYVPEISPRLEAAVLQALAKKPDERFADGNSFWAAIEHP